MEPHEDPLHVMSHEEAMPAPGVTPMFRRQTRHGAYDKLIFLFFLYLTPDYAEQLVRSSLHRNLRKILECPHIYIFETFD